MRMAESFRLVLMTDGRDTGIDGKVADGKAKVMLSAAGNGSVVYHIFDASATVDANEWANLPVTFQWTAGGDMPAIGSSYVNVSFNPVSAIGGDTFDRKWRASAPVHQQQAAIPSWFSRLTIAPRRCYSRS